MYRNSITELDFIVVKQKRTIKNVPVQIGQRKNNTNKKFEYKINKYDLTGKVEIPSFFSSLGFFTGLICI